MTCRSDYYRLPGRVHRAHKKTYNRWMQEPDEVVPIVRDEGPGRMDMLLSGLFVFGATVVMAALWWFCG